MALVLSRMRGGAAPEDAVLAVIHASAGRRRRLADEFLAFFLADLTRLGHDRLAPSLDRFLDTGDLVQSVLGDLWRDLLELRFETRASFLALLAERLRWKASDRARGLRAGKRREDLRAAGDPAQHGNAAGPSPATEAGRREDWERLVLALTRLPERDRRMLRMSLQGSAVEEIARALDLEPETARKALQRARRRARGLAGLAE